MSSPAPRQRGRYGLSRPGAAPTTPSIDCGERREEQSKPTALRRPSAFEAVPVRLSGSLSTRKTEYSKLTQRTGPLAFQTVAAPWRLHLPRAEQSAVISPPHRVPFPGFEPGRHPPEGCGSAGWPRRARTATGRWSQGRSTLGGSRTRINLALNQVRLPDCGTSAWSLWTDSNGLLRVTMPVLCPVSYRGMAAHRGFEPRLPASETGVLPIERMGIGCGRCDSNAHAARFELARSAGCHHSRMVRREGLEPPAIGLRVHCSSI